MNIYLIIWYYIQALSVSAMQTVSWCGSIAQLGEHLPYKQGVTGSSPVVPTNKFNNQEYGYAGMAQW